MSQNYLRKDGSANYDVCLYVANWPERRITHWKTLIPARAIENQAYVVALNRVGEDGNNFKYSGDSMVCDASGERINDANTNDDVIQKVILSKPELGKFRTKLNFLRDVDH